MSKFQIAHSLLLMGVWILLGPALAGLEFEIYGH